MYDQAYDEYMRNVLGYGCSPDYRSPYAMMPQDLYGINTYMPNEFQNSQIMNEELEECYPEIYKVVYPIVQKVCMKNTKPLNKRAIDDMVDDIYMNLETNDSININVNVGNTSKINSISSDRENRTTVASSSRPEVKTETRDARGDSRQKETRQRNFLLYDLIRILVLRELIGRPDRPNNRPPQRPPVRPPYPGGRPPMRPRMDFDTNYDLYDY